MCVYFDYVISFWLSIGLLSLCQGVVVCLPRALSPQWMARLHSPLWALAPVLSVTAFVAVGLVAEHGSAQVLTYLALIAVPPLAALALGWVVWDTHPPTRSPTCSPTSLPTRQPAHTSRPALALLVVPLFALAWADRGGLAGEGAAVVLSALSCVALGALIAGVTPARWLALGIVAMALADASLVISDLLQAPNNVLNATHPAGGLPRLQAAVFGSAAMGYGDLFVAGVLGGLLAATGERSRQLRGALLVALLAVAFDFLFFAVNELPATVPVASALVILVWASRRHGASWVGARSPETAPPARAPALR
jgi:hypothetical protein